MEESTIATIATEALKPFSSFIDALVGPRISRIKKWSEEQERISRLGSMEIHNLLNQYLKRLLRRVSGITTIVFPQQVLPLPSIYEPLLVNQKFHERKRKGKKTLTVKTIHPGNNYLIVDAAGMGKSTFAKHLVLELINYTEKIPVFLELRRISDTETLLDKLAKEVDENQHDIDGRQFLLLLEQGGFVIILDGFDELAENTRESIGQQITELAVNLEKNTLILTSRPEVALPEIPESNVYTINPLSEKQAKSLVLRYDKVANIDVGRRLIEQFDLVPDMFLFTPLLIVLLYRSFGFNHSIATKITSFYDDLYNALYKGHDLSKAGFAREKRSRLDSEDFRILLRGFSFLMLAFQKNNFRSLSEAVKVIDEASKLTSIRITSASLFFDDLLLAVPLLVKEGTDFRFVHKSIGEFFAAEYLSYAPNSERIIERITGSNLYTSFINTFEYLSEINPSLFRRTIVAPLAREVLSEDDANDIYIRTLSFRTIIFLGLWPKDKYTIISDEKQVINLPSAFRGEAYRYIHIYGNIHKEKYVLALEIGMERTIPEAAWRLITKEGMRFFMEGSFKFQDGDFTGLEEYLDLEQWIPITNLKIIAHANNQSVRTVVLTIFKFLDGVDISDPITVLDVDSCKKILEEINLESETQVWVEKLINNEQ